MMKKLVISLTLIAFAMPASFAFAADGNRDSLRQAWAAIEGQEKKQAASEKSAAEKAKAAGTKTKFNQER
jgi:hypothetical protein